MDTPVLRQLSDERAALVSSLTPRVWAIARSAHHTLSAIHWRGPYLISAAERLAGVERVQVQNVAASGGGLAAAEGEVLAADLSTDVAVIRVEALSAADALSETGDEEQLQLGQSVAIVGRDAQGALSAWGSVALAGPAWRSRRGGQIDQRLEFAARIDDRFEGALVASVHGGRAAMLVAGPRGRALGIPAATIERVLGGVQQHGYLPRPYLGLRLQPLWLDTATAERFGRRSPCLPVVAGVDTDSPAAAAALQPGDLISAVDERELDGVDGLREVLAASQVGQSLRLAVRRGGLAQLHTLVVAERPRETAGGRGSRRREC